MKETFTGFSMPIAKLMLAFFQGTISPYEHDQLDQWVEASEDNLKTFEEFVEIASRTIALESASNWQP